MYVYKQIKIQKQNNIVDIFINDVHLIKLNCCGKKKMANLLKKIPINYFEYINDTERFSNILKRMNYKRQSRKNIFYVNIDYFEMLKNRGFIQLGEKLNIINVSSRITNTLGGIKTSLTFDGIPYIDVYDDGKIFIFKPIANEFGIFLKNIMILKLKNIKWTFNNTKTLHFLKKIILASTLGRNSRKEIQKICSANKDLVKIILKDEKEIENFNNKNNYVEV